MPDNFTQIEFSRYDKFSIFISLGIEVGYVLKDLLNGCNDFKDKKRVNFRPFMYDIQ